MGLPVRFFLLILMLFSTSLRAQEAEFKYRVGGMFQRDPTVLNQTPVRFTLSWNEQGTNVRGVYSDNFFSDSSPVSGISGPEGRSFNVFFPGIVGGVRSMEILLMTPADVTGTVTVTLTTKDSAGTPLGVYNVAGLMSLGAAPPPAAAPGRLQASCVVGMGALTGFCGFYGGTITEDRDTANKCHHYINSNARLQLTTTGEFVLHFATTFGIQQFRHMLGDLESAPVTGSINVVNRNCGPLTGTSFEADNCQMQNLNGTFLNVAGVRSFSGNYNITDEVTGDGCTYRMILERIEQP